MSEVIEIAGDTIYVRDKQYLVRSVDAPDLFDTIDWLELAKQKHELIMLIARGVSENREMLEGLVHLIDNIQDVAEARDYPVVYGYNRAEWEQDQAEAQNNGP